MTSNADYLSREQGTVRKPWRHRRRVALVYPHHYAVGMANLGFQTVYGLLNQMEDVVCERVFAPEGPPPHPWPRPLSLESGRPLDDFDIVAFSVSFENDYPSIFALLAAAGLPTGAADRDGRHPLIVAGGVACLINPEPLAEIFDTILIGEAEVLLPEFMALFDPSAHRPDWLHALANQLPGAYVPRFYAPEYHPDGTLATYRLLADVPARATRVRLEDLSTPPACTRLVTPETTFEADFLMEVSRGCPHGCRFCAAGYVYRPARFAPLSALTACLDAAAARTNRIGLVGAAVSDLPDLAELCQHAARQGLKLHFSSLRADALDAPLIATLAGSRIKTATIAPETGSENLRTAINKHLEDDTILNAAEGLAGAGIPNLRLYFMVGLPGETAADVEAIVTLVKRIKDRFLRASRSWGRLGTITVSLNSFVPKPFTPLQWAPMESLARLKAKIRSIQKGLRPVANVRVHADSPRWAAIQALLARGDRRVGQMLDLHFRSGRPWSDLGRGAAPNPDFFVLRPRQAREVFAWEIIDHGIQRAYLWQEYQRYHQRRLSPPCPPSGCSRCGVCSPRPDSPRFP